MIQSLTGMSLRPQQAVRFGGPNNPQDIQQLTDLVNDLTGRFANLTAKDVKQINPGEYQITQGKKTYTLKSGPRNASLTTGKTTLSLGKARTPSLNYTDGKTTIRLVALALGSDFFRDLEAKCQQLAAATPGKLKF